MQVTVQVYLQVFQRPDCPAQLHIVQNAQHSIQSCPACIPPGSGRAGACQVCVSPALLLVLLGRCDLPSVLGGLLG